MSGRVGGWVGGWGVAETEARYRVGFQIEATPHAPKTRTHSRPHAPAPTLAPHTTHAQHPQSKKRRQSRQQPHQHPAPTNQTRSAPTQQNKHNTNTTSSAAAPLLRLLVAGLNRLQAAQKRGPLLKPRQQRLPPAGRTAAAGRGGVQRGAPLVDAYGGEAAWRGAGACGSGGEWPGRRVDCRQSSKMSCKSVRSSAPAALHPAPRSAGPACPAETNSAPLTLQLGHGV